MASFAQGRHAEAEAYVDRAMATSTSVLGQDHVLTMGMLMTLAIQLLDRDQVDAAARLLEKAAPMIEESSKLGSLRADHYVGLGLVAYKRKSWSEAFTHLNAASQIYIELERIAGVGGPERSPARVAPLPRAVQGDDDGRPHRNRALAQPFSLRKPFLQRINRCRRFEGSYEIGMIGTKKLLEPGQNPLLKRPGVRNAIGLHVEQCKLLHGEEMPLVAGARAIKAPDVTLGSFDVGLPRKPSDQRRA